MMLIFFLEVFYIFKISRKSVRRQILSLDILFQSLKFLLLFSNVLSFK